MGNFKEFVKGAIPAIDNIVDGLKENEIRGIVSFSVDSGGYFSAYYGDSNDKIEAIRIKTGEPVKIVTKTTEVL